MDLQDITDGAGGVSPQDEHADRDQLHQRQPAHFQVDAKGLRGVLKRAEVLLLVRVLVDHQSQHDIARNQRRPRETVRDRIRSAARKVKEQLGVELPLPKRGRPKQRIDVVLCDAETIDRLVTKAGSEGVLCGTWLDSKERKNHD